MLNIACVYKTGGDYDWRYVNRLHDNLVDKLGWNTFEFTILTDNSDVVEKVDSPARINFVALEMNLKKFWSKLELFKLKGRVLYFDLDTIILDSMDTLINEVKVCPEGSFYMMKAFNRERRDWASAIMAWNGDFSYIVHNFDEDNTLEMNYGKWEQKYISDRLQKMGVNIQNINKLLTGIRSYKRQCINQIPKDTKVICFHGRPRPHDVNWLQKEIRRYENQSCYTWANK